MELLIPNGSKLYHFIVIIVLVKEITSSRNNIRSTFV